MEDRKDIYPRIELVGTLPAGHGKPIRSSGDGMIYTGGLKPAVGGIKKITMAAAKQAGKHNVPADVAFGYIVHNRDGYAEYWTTRCGNRKVRTTNRVSMQGLTFCGIWLAFPKLSAQAQHAVVKKQLPVFSANGAILARDRKQEKLNEGSSGVTGKIGRHLANTFCYSMAGNNNYRLYQHADGQKRSGGTN
ncbi:uncharacterized protein BDZ99DRAFT_525808 [Mytilinidion resinicola]|uniref:Uncharacterized protein n=1 Tax=Mytilinidion resinicola TaxID=574789 RepID=A0A6A6Y5Y2_9PEZI|nr:uncharacterized protein BDZ99DRAFT_525808 [Mytilinidion resinicola]KAF2804216.1 hypothetical protein BDZ99DRAFT_525808 [Mytilinidion resinicola]